MSDSNLVCLLLLLLAAVVVFGVVGVKCLTTDEVPTGGTFSSDGIENVGVLCLVISAGAFVLFAIGVIWVIKFRKRD